MAANRGEANSDYEPVNPQPDRGDHRGEASSDYEPVNPQPDGGDHRDETRITSEPVIPQQANYDHSPPILTQKSLADNKPRKPFRSHSFSSHFEPRTVKKMSTVVSYTNVPAHSIQIEPLSLSDEMTLQQFVLKHGDSLPLRVRISKGIYGIDEECTISTGDCYNFHCLQHRDLVKLEDKHHRQEFSVPVNSAIKFSMVYDPHGNEKQALKGHVFPNVSDILAMTSLPKVISTLREWNSGNLSSSVSANELLIVKEVVEIPASMVGGRRQLRVYSHSNRCEKYLEEECEGHFTTRPTFTRLHLKDIFKYFANPLPMDIVLTGDPTTSAVLPSYLFSRILHVSHRYTDVLMIATGILESTQEVEPFEIPIDLDIELAVVELPEAENKKMIDETKYLLEKINETKVRHYRYINIPDETYVLQQRIFEAPPIEDSQVEGYAEAQERNRLSLEHRLQLLESQNHRYQEDVASLKPELLSVSATTDFLRKNYETLEIKVDKQMEKLQLLQTQSQLYQDDVASLKPEVFSVSAGMDLLRNHYETLENTIERQTEQLQIAQAEIESLRDEVDRLRDRLQSVSSTKATALGTLEVTERRFSESSSTGAEEQNKEFLATLDQHQV